MVTQLLDSGRLNSENYVLASLLREALRKFVDPTIHETHSSRGNDSNWEELLSCETNPLSAGKLNEDEIKEFIDFIEQSYDIFGELTRKFTDLIVSGPLQLANFENSSERFFRYLNKIGVEEPLAREFAHKFSEFVSDEMPDLEVLSAVEDLREQHRAEQPVTPKRKYPGRRSSTDADPVKFLDDVYGEEVRAGRLSVSRLQELDSALYQSLYTDMKAQGKNVSDILNPKARDYLRRATACAHILGIDSPEEAGRFFGMRPNRIASLLTR